MKHTDYTGTGESKCKYPKNRRVVLNNIPISKKTCYQFIKYLGMENEGVTIEFSNRNTIQMWGRAFYADKRILLYRKSVGIFLHELAHIISYYGLNRMPITTTLLHDYKFCKTLDSLCSQWESNLWKENLDKQ